MPYSETLKFKKFIYSLKDMKFAHILLVIQEDSFCVTGGNILEPETKHISMLSVTLKKTFKQENTAQQEDKEMKRR